MQFVRVFLCVVACSFAAAQTPVTQPSIAWKKSLNDALKEAADQKKPILVAFNMDNERANDEMARTHYHDADIVKRAGEFVCLIGSKFRHTDDPNALCPRFGSVTCDEHIAVEIECRTRFLETSTVNSPQHLFVRPDGTLHLAKVWLMSKKEMLELMLDELKKMFPERYPAEVGAESRPATSNAKEPQGENPTSAPAGGDGWGEIKGGAAAAAPKKMPKTPAELKAAILASNDDWEVKGYARALLKSEDPEARKIPAELLKDDKLTDPRRHGIILSYGFKGHKEALPLLEKLLTDKKSSVRHHAVIAVEDIGEKSSLKALRKQLETEEDERVKKDVIRAMGVCGAGDAAVAQTLIKFGADKSNVIVKNALLALGNFKGNADAEKTLMANLTAGGGGGGGRRGGGGFGAMRGKYEASAYALGQMKSKKAKEEAEKRLEREKNEFMQGLLEGLLRVLEQDFEHPSDEVLSQRQRIGEDKIRRDLEPEIRKGGGGMFGGQGGDEGGDGEDGGADGGGERPRPGNTNPRPGRPQRPNEK